MSMTPRKRGLIIVTTVIVACVVWFVGQRLRGVGAPLNTPTVSSVVVDERSVSATTASRPELTTGQRENLKIAIKRAIGSERDAVAMIDAVLEAHAVYSSPRYEDALGWFAANKMAAPSSVTSTMWPARAATLIGASIDPSTFSVKHTVVRGKRQPDPQMPVGQSMLSVTRGFQREGTVDVEAVGADAFAIRVRAVMRDIGGQTFDGVLEYEFTKRPSDGRWVISRIAIENIPPDFTCILPPV